MRPDDALAVGAARTLGLVRSDDWPMVAAHLVAVGADGDVLIRLASLTRAASPWEVDQLLDEALAEAGVQEVPIEDAGQVVARVLAQALRDGQQGQDHVIILTLAKLASARGYPGGAIGDSYYAAEWLDCECHRVSAERDDADRLEAELRALPDLDAGVALVRVLYRRIIA